MIFIRATQVWHKWTQPLSDIYHWKRMVEIYWKDCIRFHRFSRKSTLSIWKYVNSHCIFDIFVWIIDNSKWNYYCCNEQMLNLKWWICLLYVFFWGKAVTLEKKVIVAHPMHNFVSVIPLQTGYGTKKFLFHSMIIMTNCKRASCILLVIFSFKNKCKGVFNHAKLIHGLRLSNVLINKTENYISGLFFTFLLELSSYYLSILIFPHVFLR